MDFLRLFKHLLPRAESWRIEKVQKRLYKFIRGLAFWLEDTNVDMTKAGLRHYADKIYEDLGPATTRQIPMWENQFGIAPDPTLTDAQMRNRIDASWKSLGGQDPQYIQDVLHAAGFTQLFVHEWWQDSGVGALTVPPTVRSAYRILELGLINDGSLGVDGMQCEGDHAQTDDDHAQCHGSIGATGVSHYALTNLDNDPTPTVPNDITLWPYFFYITGETWTDNGAAPPTITFPGVPASQKRELERTILKISPTQNWIGIIVNFT